MDESAKKSKEKKFVKFLTIYNGFVMMIKKIHKVRDFISCRMEVSMVKAIYPGSFDPVTLGHLDIIKRAASVVDELVVGVLVNNSKSPLFTIEERVAFLEEATADIPHVSVKTFHGLTVDFAKVNQAKLIVRGLRAVTDFETEMQLAQTNHSICPDIETIFFTTSLQYSFLSSTIVKEISYYGSDIRKLVPGCVVDAIQKKFDHELC